jgi:hypothetical protein
MDMVYHLPFRDWLELDSKPAAPEPEPVEDAEDVATTAAIAAAEKARTPQG